MDIKITGLDEIVKDFRNISDHKTLDRNVARAARKVLKPVLESAKARVPVDEGDLKNSLIISSKKLRNGNRSVRVGPNTETVVRADESGSFDFSRKKRPANYAHLVELGTKTASAKPFLRPSFDEHSGDMPKKFAADMKKGLNRLMKKAGLQ